MLDTIRREMFRAPSIDSGLAQTGALPRVRVHSRVSRLHTLHRSSRSCTATANSLGGWLYCMNRETSFPATGAVFGSLPDMAIRFGTKVASKACVLTQP